MTVNGKLLSEFNGAAMLDYVIGGTPITNVIFQGMNRTQWEPLLSRFGMREISVTICFSGRSLREAKLGRSLFCQEVHEICELYIPDDGFYYRCSCKDFGSEELVGIGDFSAQVKSTFQFDGIRHDPLETVTASDGVIYCRSTMPYTSARLTATVEENAESFQLGAATFPNVVAGDVCVFDGIDGKILKNGTNVSGAITWGGSFPALVPGMNEITCPAPVTVEYYPSYI